MDIQKTVLSSGITVVTDRIPSFETASIGFFVNVGSTNESPIENGVSHFLEHMLFKGTNKRTALDISKEIESVGGYINAYTSKEVTAFHVKLLKNNTELGIDILSDMLQNSLFDEEEFQKEKAVVLQEINQTDDTPDDLVFDVFQSQCFPEGELGRPVLGTYESVTKLCANDLKSYIQNQYSPYKIIVSAAGNIDHNMIVELVDKYCGKSSSFQAISPVKQYYTGGKILKEKDIAQHHVIIGFEGVSHTSEDKYNLNVLSTILGGGMSSKLFQEVREKRGLVYSIFSFISNYKDTGIFGVYSACDPCNTKEMVKVINEELRISINSITPEEIKKAKTQLKASLLMGLESSSARMERMANQLFFSGKISLPKDIEKRIDSVDIDGIINICGKLFVKPTLTILGKKENIDDIFDILV